MAIPNNLINPTCYAILVEGTLDQRWAVWFDGLTTEQLPGGRIRIAGRLADQPALHGVLERIRDLNLVLISVQRLKDE